MGAYSPFLHSVLCVPVCHRFCSAVAIANRILETGDASDYLKFLATGGSMYPIDELKIAGVDLTSPETVGSALQVFQESLDELKSVLETLD